MKNTVNIPVSQYYYDDLRIMLVFFFQTFQNYFTFFEIMIYKNQLKWIDFVLKIDKN